MGHGAFLLSRQPAAFVPQITTGSHNRLDLFSNQTANPSITQEMHFLYGCKQQCDMKVGEEQQIEGRETMKHGGWIDGGNYKGLTIIL